MQCVSLINLPENRGVLPSKLIPQKILERSEIENFTKIHIFWAYIGSELRSGLSYGYKTTPILRAIYLGTF